MSSVSAAGTLLLIAAILPIAGCLDSMPDTISSDRTMSEAGRELLRNTGSVLTVETPPEAEFVALSLVFETTGSSVSAVEVLDVKAADLPSTVSAFVSQPAHLRPGEARTLAALAVEQGTHVGRFRITIHLIDGVGEATLDLDIGPWYAEADTLETLRLRLASPGWVELDATVGPVHVAAQTERAVPLYGYLLWPDGTRSALADFPYVVHVPAAYPLFEAGETVRFAIEAGDLPVAWSLDGGDARRGPHFEARIARGAHELRIDADGGARVHLLELHTVDPMRFGGLALVGTGDLRNPIEKVNGNYHSFVVAPGSTRALFTLHLVGNSTFQADLDLYLADEAGQWVARAVTPGSADETIVVDAPLAPGVYKLWVYLADGRAAEYRVEAVVQY